MAHRTINPPHLIFFSLLIVFSSVYFSGCYYDNEASLYPDQVCDTTNVTYSVTIKGIMSANCNNCHGSPSAGVITDTYGSLKSLVNTGKLRGVVLHLSGYQSMPQNTSMTDCEIDKIGIWIDKGAPNN